MSIIMFEIAEIAANFANITAIDFMPFGAYSGK